MVSNKQLTNHFLSAKKTKNLQEELDVPQTHLKRQRREKLKNKEKASTRLVKNFMRASYQPGILSENVFAHQDHSCSQEWPLPYPGGEANGYFTLLKGEPETVTVRR